MPQSKNSVATLTLKPMTREEAAILVDRMLGSYPSLSLHDPKSYIAAICSMLCSYPLWAGERAIGEAVVESKFAPPTPGILKPLLDGQVSTARYVNHWEKVAGDTVKQLDAPRAPRESMDELRARHGPNWGIATGRKPVPTVEQARAELIANIGQAAFDALPDAGHDTETWQKLKHKPEAA